MERKEKPKVPVKPHTLSVSEKIKNIERLAAEVQKPIKTKGEDSKETDSNSTKVVELTDERNIISERADSDGIIANNEEYKSGDDSSDDSIYYEMNADFGENIYDEILETPGVTNAVEEILAIEESYIDKLNFVIENYVEPSRLMGDQMKAVFGNIEEIKIFHELTFYPDLKQCNKDLVRILDCFSKHIIAGNFYIYVVYAMNKKRSDEERNKPAFKSFFEECQNKIGDKLGLHSLLTEPFQRFFKYQNLIESVLKKAEKKELNFMEIAATSKALHNVKKLLNTANKSMALTEVVDSKINLMNQGNFLAQNEFNIFDYNQKRKYKGNIFLFQNCVVCTERISSSKLQFKGYFPNGTSHIECINENKFLLYERDSYKIELSSEANVIQQMMEQVRQVFDINRENRNSTISNVSSCKSSDSKVSPRITIDLESLIERRIKKSASSDSLDLLSDKESNATNTKVENRNLLGLLGDKEIISTNVENRKSNSDRSSIDSGEYAGSSDDYNEKEQFKLMIKNFDKFYEKVSKNPVSGISREERNTAIPCEEIVTVAVQQNSADIIQEMLKNEIDYIRQLTFGIQIYLTHDHVNVTEDIRVNISKIFGNIQQIKDFHENTFCPNLMECTNDVTKMANVFIKFTQEGLFSNYILYALNHGNTQSLRNMRPYKEFFELRQKDVEDIHGVDYYLLLPFQHLNKYQNFMDRIIHTLNIDTDTAVMAVCSRATKNVERLIKDLQKSWSNHDAQVRKKPIRKLSNILLNGIQNIRRH